MLLQLCLFVVTVIELTSSQSTYDVTQQKTDDDACERTEQSCNQVQLMNSQLLAAVSRLERAVAELKAEKHQNKTKGTSKDMNKSNHSLAHGTKLYINLISYPLGPMSLYSCRTSRLPGLLRLHFFHHRRPRRAKSWVSPRLTGAMVPPKFHLCFLLHARPSFRQLPWGRGLGSVRSFSGTKTLLNTRL